jgi:hypothetical protein
MADALCNIAGGSSPKTSSGTYKAWLSSRSSNASARLSHWGGPYVLPDGTVVATSYTALTTATLLHAIDYDETGAVAATATNVCGFPYIVWTDALEDGTVQDAMNDCDDWGALTSTPSGRAYFGDPSNTNKLFWTEACTDAAGCTAKAHLYCFEQ